MSFHFHEIPLDTNPLIKVILQQTCVNYPLGDKGGEACSQLEGSEPGKLDKLTEGLGKQ